MQAMMNGDQLTPLERNAFFPTIEEVDDCLKLSELVNKVESLRYKDVFNEADTHGPITAHFFERNSKGAATMVITSESLKYVCIVFGVSEPDAYWEEAKRPSMQTWGPVGKTLPFGEDVKISSVTNEALFGDDLHRHLYDALNLVIKDSSKHKVFVTGFGQAGAIATAFTTYVCHKKPVVRIHNINFGSPRVGGDEWKAWVNSLKNITIWRFLLEGDMIPGIPAMIMGYRHVGHAMMFDSKGFTRAYYYNNSEEENEDTVGLSKPPEFLTPASEITGRVKDHSVSEYLSRFKRNPGVYPRKFDTINESSPEMSAFDMVLSFCI